VAAPKKEEVR